jgi:murein DD-endopeptidase MepM/ murein hydrolase activator NlpD
MIDGVRLPVDPSLVEAPSRSPEPEKAFEELFVRSILREVQRAMPDGGFLGGELEMFGDLLLDELAASLARDDRLGLAEGLGRSSDGAGPGSAPALRPRKVGGGATDLPVDGRITSRFGRRADPIEHGEHRHHAGLDIAAPVGTPIRAVADGVVVSAGDSGGYGLRVVLRHDDGRESVYAHCSRIDVRPGERIHAGETLAAVGSTGRSTGPHLHLEIREGGTPIDPERALGRYKNF